MSVFSGVIKEAFRALRRRGQLGAELRRLTARYPDLAALPQTVAASHRLFAELYEEYVTSISSPAWAVSLQTAALLHAVCMLLKPRTVLDLGSGFSSFAFRRYARDATASCIVHSVDEDAQWLGRTRGFLAAHNLQTDGMFLWTAFEEGAARYDLILHDMGRMKLRLEALPRALALSARDGLLVLDDMHRPEYAMGVVEHCHRAGFDLCSLRAFTLDRFGRYAYAATRFAPG